MEYCEAHTRCAHLLPPPLRALPGPCPEPRCTGGRGCPLALQGVFLCNTSQAAADALAGKQRQRGMNQACHGCNAEPVCGACGTDCDTCGELYCLRCLAAGEGNACCQR